MYLYVSSDRQTNTSDDVPLCKVTMCLVYTYMPDGQTLVITEDYPCTTLSANCIYSGTTVSTLIDACDAIVLQKQQI